MLSCIVSLVCINVCINIHLVLFITTKKHVFNDPKRWLEKLVVKNTYGYKLVIVSWMCEKWQTKFSIFWSTFLSDKQLPKDRKFWLLFHINNDQIFLTFGSWKEFPSINVSSKSIFSLHFSQTHPCIHPLSSELPNTSSEFPKSFIELNLWTLFLYHRSIPITLFLSRCHLHKHREVISLIVFLFLSLSCSHSLFLWT